MYIQAAEQAQKERAAKKAQGQFHFITMKDLGDCTLYFYLLPPWSQRGALYRQIWKHFKLPDASYAMCWKSYDVFRPGMGEQCPICNALKAVEKHVDEKVIDQMWSKGRSHINAFILGKRELNDRGDAVDPFIFLEQFPKKLGVDPKRPRVIELPITVCDELMSQQNGPMGFICIPKDAVVCILRRYGEGIDTDYKLTFSGVDDPIGGFRPTRTPMFQTPEDETACLGTKEAPGLPDLDRIWPLPDTEGVNEAHKIAQAIRMRFGLPDQAVYPSQYTAPVAASPGAQGYPAPGAMPQGAPAGVPPVGATPPGVPSAPSAPPTQYYQPQSSLSAQYPPGTTPFDGDPAQPPATAPVAPSQPPPQQPAPQPAVPVGVPPMGVPPVGVPPVGAPTAALATVSPVTGGPPPMPPSAQSALVGPAIPGLNLDLLKTNAFGPHPPADGTPMARPACFRRMDLVIAGPNKHWCDPSEVRPAGCPFKQICRTVSPRA